MAGTIAPNIVTDGLVLYLDAANTKSYPGSGTTWSDLSRNGYNGTLTNGPLYTSSSNGTVALDGLNDYVAISGGGTNNTHAWTSDGSVGSSILFMEIWVKTNDSSGRIISKPWNGLGQYNMVVSSNGFSLLGNTSTFISFSNIANNTWRHLNVWATSNQIGYVIDGTISNSQSHSVVGGIPSSGNSNLTLLLGSLYDYGSGWGGVDAFSMGGEIAIFRKYNRILSPTEILQNYNATKTRYGL
jgi:hypothetical protein